MMAGAFGEPPTMSGVYTLPGRIKDDDVRPAVRHRDAPAVEGLDLSPEHRRMLFEESGIDPEVAAGRGYKTVRSRSELSQYPEWQRRLGLHVPMFSPDGSSTSSQLRPNTPRRKGPKYETPGGSRIIADVHPRNFEAVRDARRDLWITEGCKKGDALASRGLCAISLAGVWNFAVAKTKGRHLLPCFDSVALEGRRVFVVFDSDVMTKPEVREALSRLVAALEGRGADVFVVYLPDSGDGKTGVDDYLSAGHTVADLRGLARRFDPSEATRIRLSRDERLRLSLENAGVRYRSIPWKGMGGKSASDVAKALLARAAKSGKVVEDGISVRAAWGPLAVEAGIGSSRTLGKAFRRLEESGFGYRDTEGRKPGESTRFVIRAKVRASVKQYERKPRAEEKATSTLQGFDHATLHLRGDPRALHQIREEVPALRWSMPAFKPKRGTISGTRRVRRGPKPEPRDRIERLGKTRGAVIDELVMAGGSLDLEGLAAAMQIKRARDLRRRTLPMLEGFGIISVGDGAVSLVGEWRVMLEEARKLGEEVEAEEQARELCRRRSRAYRSRERSKATPHWTQNPDASGAASDLERVEDAIEAGLSEGDRRALEAIEAFEDEQGRGSFKWNHAGAKEMFYSGPITGLWPDTDQLGRIRKYLDLLKASKRKVAA